jgi:hypothetical protein
MNALIAQLRENARLRVLLAAVVFIVVFVKVLDLRDTVAAKRVDTKRSETEFKRWSAIAGEHGWGDRVADVRARRQAAEALLWTGSTSMQTQLAVQEWLLGHMKAARLGAARVSGSVQPKGTSNQAAEPVTGTRGLSPDLTPLRFAVSFELTPDSVERFAGVLDASGKAFVIDALNVRRQPLPRVEVELVTLARLVPAIKDSPSSASTGALK